MAISLIASDETTGTSITIPTHQINDTLLFFVYRDGATGAPTIPSDCQVVHQSVVGSFGYIIAAYKIATTTSETSGTWTNASHIAVMIFRGAADTLVLPEAFATNSTSTTTVTFGAQLAGSLRTNQSDLAVVGTVAQRNIANAIGTAPGAMVNILTGGDGANYQIATHWDDARTTAWANTSITLTNAALNRTQVLGLFEQAYTPTGSSGAFRQVNIRGGADQ
jgi:hypothetical protein